MAAGTSRAAGDWGTGSKGRKWAEEAEADSVHVILFMPKEGAAHGKKGGSAREGVAWRRKGPDGERLWLSMYGDRNFRMTNYQSHLQLLETIFT